MAPAGRGGVRPPHHDFAGRGLGRGGHAHGRSTGSTSSGSPGRQDAGGQRAQPITAPPACPRQLASTLSSSLRTKARAAPTRIRPCRGRRRGPGTPEAGARVSGWLGQLGEQLLGGPAAVQARRTLSGVNRYTVAPPRDSTSAARCIRRPRSTSSGPEPPRSGRPAAARGPRARAAAPRPRLDPVVVAGQERAARRAEGPGPARPAARPPAPPSGRAARRSAPVRRGRRQRSRASRVSTSGAAPGGQLGQHAQHARRTAAAAPGPRRRTAPPARSRARRARRPARAPARCSASRGDPPPAPGGRFRCPRVVAGRGRPRRADLAVVRASPAAQASSMTTAAAGSGRSRALAVRRRSRTPRPPARSTGGGATPQSPPSSATSRAGRGGAARRGVHQPRGPLDRLDRGRLRLDVAVHPPAAQVQADLAGQHDGSGSSTASRRCASSHSTGDRAVDRLAGRSAPRTAPTVTARPAGPAPPAPPSGASASSASTSAGSGAVGEGGPSPAGNGPTVSRTVSTSRSAVSRPQTRARSRSRSSVAASAVGRTPSSRATSVRLAGSGRTASASSTCTLEGVQAVEHPVHAGPGRAARGDRGQVVRQRGSSRPAGRAAARRAARRPTTAARRRGCAEPQPVEWPSAPRYAPASTVGAWLQMLVRTSGSWSCPSSAGPRPPRAGGRSSRWASRTPGPTTTWPGVARRRALVRHRAHAHRGRPGDRADPARHLGGLAELPPPGALRQGADDPGRRQRRPLRPRRGCGRQRVGCRRAGSRGAVAAARGSSGSTSSCSCWTCCSRQPVTTWRGDVVQRGRGPDGARAPCSGRGCRSSWRPTARRGSRWRLARRRAGRPRGRRRSDGAAGRTRGGAGVAGAVRRFEDAARGAGRDPAAMRGT